MKPILAILILFLAVFANANPQVDSLFSDYDKPNVPGAAVAIFHEGQIAYRQAYGLARVKTKEPVSTKTNFRLASLSKQFTAMAIMILLDRNMLQLSDTLTSIFPDFPAYGSAITVQHLLHHQSGLKDYENHLPGGQAQVSDEDVLTILKKQSSGNFRPGSQYSYSNSGYCVLSNIVAKVSGRSFPEFMRQEIFEPLEMRNSLAYVKGGPEIENRAYGHTGTSETDQSTTSATLGDGGIYTSVEDWFLWDKALYHNPLVSPLLQAQAFTPGILNDGSKTTYGYGWVLDTYGGRRRQTHTGSTIGFRTAVTRFPDQKLTVVVLVNRASASPWDTAKKVADLYL